MLDELHIGPRFILHLHVHNNFLPSFTGTYLARLYLIQSVCQCNWIPPQYLLGGHSKETPDSVQGQFYLRHII